MSETQLYTALCILAVLCGMGIGGSFAESRMRSEAIEKNHAYYHPQTGEFTWKEAKP